jgi:hypothetical protein
MKQWTARVWGKPPCKRGDAAQCSEMPDLRGWNTDLNSSNVRTSFFPRAVYYGMSLLKARDRRQAWHPSIPRCSVPKLKGVSSIQLWWRPTHAANQVCESPRLAAYWLTGGLCNHCNAPMTASAARLHSIPFPRRYRPPSDTPETLRSGDAQFQNPSVPDHPWINVLQTWGLSWRDPDTPRPTRSRERLQSINVPIQSNHYRIAPRQDRAGTYYARGGYWLGAA